MVWGARRGPRHRARAFGRMRTDDVIVSRVTTRSFVFSSPLRDEARGWIYFALSDACARKNEYPSYFSRVVVFTSICISI